MKSSYLLVIFLAFLSLTGKGVSSECSEGSCALDSDLDIINDKETSSYSQFEIRNLQRDLEFITTHGESPRNIKFSINSTDGITPNISINLPSFKKMNSGANALMIAGEVSSVSINLSGRNGDNADRASRICAERILNGVYGPAIKSQFLSNRIINPSLPMNECTSTDIGNIQNGEFRCDPGFSEFDGSSIRGSRWRPRRVCESESQRQMCVAKKVRISCTWLAEKIKTGNSCSQGDVNGSEGFDPKPRGLGYMGKQWVCDPGLAVDNLYNGWKMQFDPFIRDESWLVARRNMGMTDEAICDELTGRDTFFLESFSDLTSNYILVNGGGTKQLGRSTYNKTKNEIHVKRGFWYGYYKHNSVSNPYQVIPISEAAIPVGVVGTKTCQMQGRHDNYYWWEVDIFNGTCTPISFFRTVETIFDTSTHGGRFWNQYCSPGSELECDRCASNPSFRGRLITCTGINSFKVKEYKIEPTNSTRLKFSGGVFGAFSSKRVTGVYYTHSMNQFFEASQGLNDAYYFYENYDYQYTVSIPYVATWKNYTGYFAPSSVNVNYTIAKNTSFPRFFIPRESTLPLNTRVEGNTFSTERVSFYEQRGGHSDGHTISSPFQIYCYVHNFNLQCDNSVLWEANSIRYFMRVPVYASNGRIINYVIDWTIGRY